MPPIKGKRSKYIGRRKSLRILRTKTVKEDTHIRQSRDKGKKESSQINVNVKEDTHIRQSRDKGKKESSQINVNVKEDTHIRQSRDKEKKESSQINVNVKERSKLPNIANLEEATFNWFQKQSSSDVQVRGCDIQNEAERLSQHLDFTDFKASTGWLWSFRHRHGISNKYVSRTNPSVNGDAFKLFHEKLHKIIEHGKLEPHQVYNGDETSLYWKALPMNTQVAKNAKFQTSHSFDKERVSVLFCANAGGSHRLKPAFVGKLKQPHEFLGIIQRLPVHYYSDPCSCFTNEIIKEWFKEAEAEIRKFQMETLFIPPDAVRAIVLLDNAPVHLCSKSLSSSDGRIQCLFIPPDITSHIQPMDQGIIAAVKRLYKMKFVDQVLLIADRNEKDDERYRRIQRSMENICYYNLNSCILNLANAWEELKPCTFANGWKRILKDEENLFDFQGFETEDFSNHFCLAGEHEVTDFDINEWLEADDVDPGYQVLSEYEIAVCAHNGTKDKGNINGCDYKGEKMSSLRNWLDRMIMHIDYSNDPAFKSYYEHLFSLRELVIKRQHHHLKQLNIETHFSNVLASNQTSLSHEGWSSVCALLRPSMPSEDQSFISALPELALPPEDESFISASPELSLSPKDQSFISSSPPPSDLISASPQPLLPSEDHFFISKSSQSPLPPEDQIFISASPQTSLPCEKQSSISGSLQPSMPTEDQSFIPTSSQPALPPKDLISDSPQPALPTEFQSFISPLSRLSLPPKDQFLVSLLPKPESQSFISAPSLLPKFPSSTSARLQPSVLYQSYSSTASGGQPSLSLEPHSSIPAVPQPLLPHGDTSLTPKTEEHFDLAEVVKTEEHFDLAEAVLTHVKEISIEGKVQMTSDESQKKSKTSSGDQTAKLDSSSRSANKGTSFKQEKSSMCKGSKDEEPLHKDIEPRSPNILNPLEILGDSQFPRAHSSISHENKNPVEKEKTVISCDICNKIMNSRSHFERHRRTHNRKNRFSCDICHKSFAHKGSLVAHTIIHTGEKPFSCDICHKSFSRRVVLRKHIKIHTGEKLFSCDICNKSFIGKTDLLRHIKTHTGEKSFSCDICYRCFALKGDLVRHIKIHNGERPFSCDICHKSFPQNVHLQSHIRTHTGEKPFSCKICDKSFVLKQSLKRHVKTHTGYSEKSP